MVPTSCCLFPLYFVWILNAYKNCPSVGGPEFPAVDNYLVVDASDPVHVYIEPACVNYYIGEGQVLCLWTMADDYYNNRYGNWELADKEGICGRIEDGTITFPARTLLAGFIEETAFNPSEHDIMWKQVNTNSMFRIKLPGTPNTDIGISLVGINQDKTGVQYEISIPADTEYAKIGVFEGEYTDSMRAAVENDETQLPAPCSPLTPPSSTSAFLLSSFVPLKIMNEQ